LKDLALVHLVRHANGFEPFEVFMASYEAHASGREHDLVLLFKGFPTPADAAPYLERAAEGRPRALHVDDAGLDLAAYLTAAQRLSHSLVGFANSFSEVLADGWLERLCAPLSGGAGAAGATGSWGGGLSYKLFQAGVPGGYADVFSDRRAVRVAMHELGGGRYRGDLVHWIGNLAYTIRDFRLLSLFPAVHLRTNGFVIERELLLSLRAGRLDSKRAVYRLESGRGNMTAQLTALGRPPVVVDRHGTARSAPDWPAGDVFWQGRQQDLLVADNQTRRYANGSPHHRDVLSRFAWGLAARPWTDAG
jgi:hypothetical protein